MKEQKIIYKGIEITQNPLTGNWFLFFNKEKWPNQSPCYGSLAEMKRIVNNAVELNRKDDFIIVE
jgi:hypothetical protein